MLQKNNNLIPRRIAKFKDNHIVKLFKKQTGEKLSFQKKEFFYARHSE